MKTVMFFSILLCVIARPVVAELTQDDLNKIHLIVKEAITPIEADIAVLKTEVQNLNARFDSTERNFNARFNIIEKNFDRQSNLIIACIAVPMALIAILVSWRSLQDKAQSKRIQELADKVEVLEKQRIVSP